MKKNQQQSNFPFINQKEHIYNILIDNEMSSIDTGKATINFELHANLVDEEGNKVDGMVDGNVIKLEMALEDGPARETILHEILHCMAEIVGLHENNFDRKFIVTTNEVIVNTLTQQFIIFNNLNPRLLPIILA